jgi:hypothetical protein
MYDMLYKDETTKCRKNVHKLILVVGVFAGVISFIIAFSALVKAFNEEEELGDIDDALMANMTTEATTSIDGINQNHHLL